MFLAGKANQNIGILFIKYRNFVVIYFDFFRNSFEKNWIRSSSSSCSTASTDIPDTLSPLLPIIHPVSFIPYYSSSSSPIIHHHHHVVPLALISQKLSRHFSLSFILYPHIATVCMFELVVLLLLGQMWGSIGVNHLWVRPAFPAASCMSVSSNFDSFRDGWQVAV